MRTFFHQIRTLRWNYFYSIIINVPIFESVNKIKEEKVEEKN